MQEEIAYQSGSWVLDNNFLLDGPMLRKSSSY